MANVRIIAPTETQRDVLRVAAYCRVSSDSSDQLHSYAAQIKNYTEQIAGHPGWELVDIYADEGLTGTKMEKRDDFNRLLADCRKGKIDKVLVKSISRFARNTRDCLAALRELNRLGVYVKFEKENIDTETLTTELMVSVSGSLAQEESVSIAKNLRMSYQRRMERGEFITCKAPFGYRLIDGKKLEIYQDEAVLVKWIFASYLSGSSTVDIAAAMSEKGIQTRDGKSIWNTTTITYILRNEKYVGDALCQKTLATDAFPFVKKRNDGEKDQYYVESTHPSIISRENFEKVQVLLNKRSQRCANDRKQYPLNRRIKCSLCGATFTRRKTKNGLVTWCCHSHDQKASSCPTGRIAEQAIYDAFVRMYNKLKRHEGVVLRPALTQLGDLKSALHRGNPAMMAVNKAIAQATEQNYKISKLQTSGLLDADACAAKLSAISAQLTGLRAERRRLLANDDIDDTADTLKQTVETIHDGPDRLGSFDEALFTDLVERIIAESATKIRFRLFGGIELAETLPEVRR